MSKIIRKIQGLWICNLFSCLTILKRANSSKHAYGSFSNSNLEWFCKWLCNTLLLNGFIHTSGTLPHLYNITSCSTISNEHSRIQMHLKFIDKSNGVWICISNAIYSFKMECSTHQYHEHHHCNLIHVIVHCTLCWSYDCHVADRSGAGTRDHPLRWRPVTEPRQQGKQTPIDHVYKIPFPSQSRLCMFRRSPCIDSTA